MRYLSVCSGIEAATVAWHPLGWKPVAFSEVEPFPCAVLQHHYPDVPNLGDMTKIDGPSFRGKVDVLVGGTPCQSFSVAGYRRSLEDPRGNLTLKFVELADEIEPAVVLWENVPGVLNTKDNAFGCLLGALSGEDGPVEPPGKRWTNAGYVLGPKRAVAWRVLDAQYFGVAQRRRRVFLVGCPRDGTDPREILFESEGRRRDTAPSREARESFAHDVAPSIGASGERCGESRGQDPVVAFTQNQAGDILTGPISPAINQNSNASGRNTPKILEVTPPLKGEGFDASEGRGTPMVPCFWNGEQVTQTLDAVLHKGQTMPEKNRFPAVLVPQVAATITSGVKPGGAGHGARSGHAKDANLVPTVAPPCSASGPPFSRTGNERNEAEALVVMPIDRQNSFLFNSNKNGLGVKPSGQPSYTLTEAWHHGIATNMSVRRLTPRECERLQGFPDDYTLIPTNKRNWRLERDEMRDYFRCTFQSISDDDLDRLAADGPRYKAIGNSMAVSVMHWIGKRIEEALR